METDLAIHNLHHACFHGLLDKVKELHAQGVSLNARCAAGHSPLSSATMRGKVKIIKYLIQNGADVNERDQKGHCAIYFAVHREKPRAASVLIQSRADADAHLADGMSLLMIAASQKSGEMARILIDAGANVNQRDRKGNIALRYAIKKHNLSIVDMLVRAGASSLCFNADESHQMTAVVDAIENGAYDVLRFLMHHTSIDINEHFHLENERSALTWVTTYTKDRLPLEVAEIILQAPDLRVDDAVVACGISNVTALTVAVDLSHEPMVKLLLARGADPNWKYDLSQIPLVVCASGRGNPRILRALLDARADPGAQHEGQSALEVAEVRAARMRPRFADRVAEA